MMEPIFNEINHATDEFKIADSKAISVPRCIVLFISFFISLDSYCQQFQWNKLYEFSMTNFLGGINCDSLNNIYLGGAFYNLYSSTGKSGFYRTKLDQSGNMIWSDTTNLIGTHYPAPFAGDKSGNSYIGGECSINFKVGDSLLSFPSSGSNGYLVKLNSNGIVLWTQALSKAVPKSIITGNNNLIYITGRANAPSQLDGINFNYGGFIAKFNAFGQCQKVIHTGTKGIFFSGIDTLNNIYIQVGDITETKTLCKYNNNDSLEWSVPITGDIIGMSVDKAGNSYFTAGTPSGSLAYKINPLGQFVWINTSPNFAHSGFVYPDYKSNVYYSIERSGDDYLNYLNTYDNTTGAIFSSQLISVPNDNMLYHAKMTLDHNNNLIISAEQMGGGLQPINSYKYTFASITSVNEQNLSENNNLRIFPNPNHGCFQINYLSDKITSVQIRIIDSKGQIVYSFKQQKKVNSFNSEIDLSERSKGIYFIEVITDEKRLVKKIVLE